jgi:hypothetical protein
LPVVYGQTAGLQQTFVGSIKDFTLAIALTQYCGVLIPLIFG